MKIQEGFNLRSAFPCSLMNCVLLGAIWPPPAYLSKVSLDFSSEKIQLYFCVFVYVFEFVFVFVFVFVCSTALYWAQSGHHQIPQKYCQDRGESEEIMVGGGGRKLFSFLVRTLHVTAVSKEYEVCVGYSPSNPQTAVPTRKLPR